ncbi:UPAR/Ly6 domain-containing protein bero-like [Anticarsia gemmatalis]|uniref:UPAR/Ly6 domain-containing protein bero-like n=1 Tax=Anticarsia gemmatalis TaxID=129554 RepID=UPI003F76CC5C
MARQGFAALSLAVLLALFEVGSCIRCYQCNSQNDPTCLDPYKGKNLVDCSSQESVNYNQLYLRTILPNEVSSSVVGAPRYCHKIVLQTGTTIRTCLDANPNDINHTCRTLENWSKGMPNDNGSKLKYCSVCDKDSCNGASSVAFSFPLATLALIATYLLCKQ